MSSVSIGLIALPTDTIALGWPLWTLAGEMPTRRVLLYAEATVFARYCVDDDGRVVRVDVTVS